MYVKFVRVHMYLPNNARTEGNLIPKKRSKKKKTRLIENLSER